MEIFFIAVAGIFALVFMIQYHKSKKAKAAKKSIEERTDFNADVSFVSTYDQRGLAIDSAGEQILFSDLGNETIGSFEDLMAVELLEDDSSITRTNRGSQLAGAAVGGLLLGGVGAIVGGLTGSSSSQSTVKSIKLRIVRDNIDQPNFDITFLKWPGSKGLVKSHPVYKNSIEEAATWHSRIANILKKLSERDHPRISDRTSESSHSVADEIQKLADLRKDGLLTETEFDSQKSKLLADQTVN